MIKLKRYKRGLTIAANMRESTTSQSHEEQQQTSAQCWQSLGVLVAGLLLIYASIWYSALTSPQQRQPCVPDRPDANTSFVQNGTEMHNQGTTLSTVE